MIDSKITGGLTRPNVLLLLLIIHVLRKFASKWIHKMSISGISGFSAFVKRWKQPRWTLIESLKSLIQTSPYLRASEGCLLSDKSLILMLLLLLMIILTDFCTFFVLGCWKFVFKTQLKQDGFFRKEDKMRPTALVDERGS